MILQSQAADVWEDWGRRIEAEGASVPVSGQNMLGVAADLLVMSQREDDVHVELRDTLRQDAYRIVRLVMGITDPTNLFAVEEAWEDVEE
jgi:hypothetical protein